MHLVTLRNLLAPQNLLRRASLLPLAAGVASTALLACSSSLAGLSGDGTNGERGRTRWSIADGLCPGLAGSCALDVPLAVGASLDLTVAGAEGAQVTATYTGAVQEAGPILVNEESSTRVRVRVRAAGAGRVELSDAHGVLDAASIEGRVVTRLECGQWSSSDGLDWRMSGLVVTDTFSGSVPPEGSEGEGQLTLVCRASDDAGPILSADAISWTILSGSENLQIASTGLLTVRGNSASGARIYAFPREAGETVVRVQIGEVSRDLTITSE